MGLVNKRLLRLIKKRGLTSWEVAELLNVTESTVQLEETMSDQEIRSAQEQIISSLGNDPDAGLSTSVVDASISDGLACRVKAVLYRYKLQ